MPKRERRPFSDEVLEVLRERAVTMAELGHSQRTIAAALGVHKNTVSRWLIAWRTSGAAALKPHRRGRRPQEQMLVSPAQAAEIQQLITEHCPDRLGLSFALGPGSRAGSDPVRDLIRKRYGLTLAIRTVGITCGSLRSARSNGRSSGRMPGSAARRDGRRRNPLRR
jgi:transposase